MHSRELPGETSTGIVTRFFQINGPFVSGCGAKRFLLSQACHLYRLVNLARLDRAVRRIWMGFDRSDDDTTDKRSAEIPTYNAPIQSYRFNKGIENVAVQFYCLHFNGCHGWLSMGPGCGEARS